MIEHIELDGWRIAPTTPAVRPGSSSPALNYGAMEQRSPDPFFEQLKAEIQQGVDEADRHELSDEIYVFSFSPR